MMSTEQIDAALASLRTQIEKIGVVVGEDEDGAGMFALDFNSAILADPYLTGTGYLPDRETAEGVAALVLSMLRQLAVDLVAATPDPEREFCWTDPMREAEEGNWCMVVSWERDAYDGDPRGGDPVVEEQFYGDEWFVAGVSMPWTLSETDRTKLAKVTAALPEPAAV